MKAQRHLLDAVRLLKWRDRWLLRFQVGAADVVFVASRSVPHLRRLVIHRGSGHPPLPPDSSLAA